MATVQPELVQEAERHLRAELEPAIWNHCQRVRYLSLAFLNGRHGEQTEDVAIAALFHDSGTADSYSGADRFEVAGANAAARFLTRHGWPDSRIKPVWDAIALHTSPGIAENAGWLPALIRTAVTVDFGAEPPLSHSDLDPRRDLERSFPRQRIEVVLAERVTSQVDHSADPERKAPVTSWAAHLLAGRPYIDPRTGLNPNF